MGHLQINDTSLKQEATKMLTLAQSLSNSILEYIRINIGNKPDYFQSIVAIVQLIKCFRAHLWEDSIYLCKQLNQIGSKYARNLAAKGKTSFQALINSCPREIEAVSDNHFMYRLALSLLNL